MIQQTSVWCWAATAQMVLEYFDFPDIDPVGNYQCGMVASTAGPRSPCY
ncbi:MAG: papain-like cysteine protease family protein [Hyphomicrobiaceae bacterium]